MIWIKIRSWHRQDGDVDANGRVKTVCGRWVAPGAPVAADIPHAEKSCESCLRLIVNGD
jgi:hypothetical protein